MGGPELAAKPKLSDVEVAEIRDLMGDGALLADVAERFGVSESYVRKIVKGEVRPVVGSHLG